ncbi:MAG: hypothetical protein SFU86_09845 [Pirellulaceae bacterium]|nr:hypothetical protein [Pirellulaceae bacterium]
MESRFFWPVGWMLLLVIAQGGCAESRPLVEAQAPTESSVEAQIVLVEAGTIDRIQVKQTPLADPDVAKLAGLAKLRELLIDHRDSRVTAASLAKLVDLPKLTHLRIRGTGIDDAALAEIARIRTLTILNVPRGDFTDQGLSQLAALPNLMQLRIGSPKVTPTGIKSLAGFPALRRLHLIDVPVGDAGLADLAAIAELQSLYIDGAQFSDAALDDFFRRRPNLHVHFDQQHHDRDPNPDPH